MLNLCKSLCESVRGLASVCLQAYKKNGDRDRGGWSVMKLNMALDRQKERPLGDCYI